MAASASAVSRVLKAAGLPRSQWIASSRVRGWGNSTEGFATETVTEYDKHANATFPTGTIRVEWRIGSWATDAAAAMAKGNEQIARAAEVLTEKGYSVEKHTQATSGNAYLHVTKED